MGKKSDKLLLLNKCCPCCSSCFCINAITDLSRVGAIGGFFGFLSGSGPFGYVGGSIGAMLIYQYGRD